jgi:cell division protease FtsH
MPTPKPPSPQPIPPRWRSTWVWIFALGFFVMVMGQRLFVPVPKKLSYSEFKEHLARGEVETVVLGKEQITGTLRAVPGVAKPAEEPSKEKPAAAAGPPFETVQITPPDEKLLEELQAAKVRIDGEPAVNPLWSFFLFWVLPFAVVFLLFGGAFRGAAKRAGTQIMGFGKSRAKLSPETGTGVTFDDVAGCDEAKAELREMVDFLRDPSRFTALGGRIPKGVLLLGPPGTGKTLLARAVAGEARVPFFSITGSDFVEMFVGVGAARVRDLFEQAKAKAPCIVFIDEIDAVGRQRGVSMGVVNDEREQTLNQLLSEMDGFEINSGVILLAATNRPEILDRALLRPGRFDRQVVIDAPDLVGREAILRVHARGKPLSPDVDLVRVAQGTPGMSGADLANTLNEAALTAAHAGRKEITQVDIEWAIEKVIAGPERRSRRLGPVEKRRVAYHESGHALVAAYSPTADPVQKISIVPRGRAALGFTMQLPEEEQYLRTRAELSERLRVMLGGRAAEELVLGEISTGAQDDLQHATALARHMVCTFGMSERLGLTTSARPIDGHYLGLDGAVQRDCSEETAREIDLEVKDMLTRAHDEAKAILTANRDELERVAAALLERETLDRASFEAARRVSAPVPAAASRS